STRRAPTAATTPARAAPASASASVAARRARTRRTCCAHDSSAVNIPQGVRMAAKVGARYQMVIEKDVRERLGIEPGAIAVQTVVDGKLEAQSLPAPHNRSLAGTFHKYSKGPVDDDEWHKIKAPAWDAAMAA